MEKQNKTAFDYYLNMRDLGGLTGENGRKIKTGLLLRSPVLFADTEEKRKAIDQLNLVNVIDFRGDDEANDLPDYIPSGVNYKRKQAIKDGNSCLTIRPSTLVKALKDRDKQSILSWDEGALSMYADMAFDSEIYRDMFEIIKRGEKLLFHCTSGKDRTGVAGLLVCLLLGVSKEDAFGNFLYTNIIKAKEIRKRMFKIRMLYWDRKILTALRNILGVRFEQIQLTYDSILKKYDSLESFFLNEFGIDEKKRQEILDFYLEK